MIVYPENYTDIGQPVELEKIEVTILQVLSEIDCSCISFSGGLDSSLMLYYMSRVHRNVHAITMGCSETHPDVVYAKSVVSKFDNVSHEIYIPSAIELETSKKYFGDFDGDEAVRLFYKYVERCTDRIVACDGIDEFMCGYYAHQEQLNEDTYYKFLRELSDKHLVPLNCNSGNVKVYLPYLDSRLLLLYSQIPISDKVDKTHRKKLLVEMAKGKIPDGVISRRKYGFCDVLSIKD